MRFRIFHDTIRLLGQENERKFDLFQFLNLLQEESTKTRHTNMKYVFKEKLVSSDMKTCRHFVSMGTVAVVFWSSNKMAERLPEIELDEIQELKENTENKNTKNRSTKTCSWGGGTLSSRARLRKATKCSKSYPRCHFALRNNNNVLASYYKQLTSWFLRIWYKYRSLYLTISQIFTDNFEISHAVLMANYFLKPCYHI